jgi:hypothetical protein
MGVSNTSMIALSTPSDSGNYYSSLFSISGSFNNIQIEMACEECVAAYKPELCTHKLADMPYWKGAATHQELKKFQSNDDYMRESMGLITDGGATKAFCPALIDKFFGLSRFSYYDSTGVVFVVIDPNGGSVARNVSEMVVMSIGRNKKGNFVVTKNKNNFIYLFISYQHPIIVYTHGIRLR